jgi:hypothetical protein
MQLRRRNCKSVTLPVAPLFLLQLHYTRTVVLCWELRILPSQHGTTCLPAGGAGCQCFCCQSELESNLPIIICPNFRIANFKSSGETRTFSSAQLVELAFESVCSSRYETSSSSRPRMRNGADKKLLPQHKIGLGASHVLSRIGFETDTRCSPFCQNVPPI